jgi:hypothetical protein
VEEGGWYAARNQETTHTSGAHPDLRGGSRLCTELPWTHAAIFAHVESLTGAVLQVITPQKKKPGSGIVTLTLDTQALVAEGVLTWAAFKAAYMTPE